MELGGSVGNGMKLRITDYVVFEMTCLHTKDLQIPKNGAHDWSVSLNTRTETKGGGLIHAT